MKIDISAQDQGRRIEAHTGDVLCVQLAENPTTGFRWFVQAPLPVSLEQAQDVFTPGHGAPGAGGTRELQFLAKSPVEFRLTLSLRREWEEPGREMESLTISGAIL